MLNKLWPVCRVENYVQTQQLAAYAINVVLNHIKNYRQSLLLAQPTNEKKKRKRKWQRQRPAKPPTTTSRISRIHEVAWWKWINLIVIKLNLRIHVLPAHNAYMKPALRRSIHQLPEHPFHNAPASPCPAPHSFLLLNSEQISTQVNCSAHGIGAVIINNK